MSRRGDDSAERPRPSLEADAGRALRVGRWRVEPRAHRLVPADGGEGNTVRVEPKVMDVLLCLARRPGEAVTREELLAAAWPGVIVGDDAVNSAVSKLRRALAGGEGDGGGNRGEERRYIETVPKVGYRLVAPVEWGGEEAGVERGRRSPLRRRLALAVPLLAVSLVTAVLVTAGWLDGRDPGSDAGRSLPTDAVGALQAVPITTDRGLEIQPVLSPVDAQQVVYVRRGPDDPATDLWIQLVDGGERLRLTEHPGSEYHPAWLPRGDRVAFVRLSRRGCELRMVSALGGSEQALGPCGDGYATGLDVSPDGRWLVYPLMPGDGGPAAVMRRALTANVPDERLTDPPPGGFGDLQAALSPDGTRLAYLRSRTRGLTEVLVQPFPRGPVRNALTVDLQVHGLDWTPDGRHLVVAMNRGGPFGLWRVPAEGGEPVLLHTAGGDDQAELDVGFRGRRIVYEQWKHEINLYRIDPAAELRAEPGAAGEAGTASADPTPVAASNRWDWYPALSPDGSRLAFVSDRSGTMEVWLKDAATGQSDAPYRLTTFAGPQVSDPAWSPDGERLALVLRRDGNADVHLLHVTDRTVRRLTRSPALDLHPTWSADGRSVLFSSDRGGAWGLWRRAADGSGRARPLDVGPARRGQETPDGRWLYYTRHHEAGLWRRPLFAGTVGSTAERVLADQPGDTDGASWTVAGDAVWLVTRAAGTRMPHLSRLNHLTLELTAIAPLPRLLPGGTLATDRTGRQVVYPRNDRSESDVYLLEEPTD